MKMRVAVIRRMDADDADEARERIQNYMPGNYQAVYAEEDVKGFQVVIAGHDFAGWTMDDYVLPRLASGLYFGYELTSDNPLAGV